MEILDPKILGEVAVRLDGYLRNCIIGQDEGIETIVGCYQTVVAGLTGLKKPIATLLFLGPTGCGKTRIVEATAEAVVGDANAVIKIDCAEFQHSHEIAKLVGSPPGYLGHRETHPFLSQENLNKYHTEQIKISFVLFDEIEKASDALWNLLLGILDKATLTLGDNRRVDFSRAMIFMTGNLGGREIMEMFRPGWGFGQVQEEVETKKTAKCAIEAAKRKFTPEFLNRIDRVVVFNALGEEELREILDIELETVQVRIQKARVGIKLDVTDEAREFLLKEGTDLKFGARPLKRVLEERIIQPIANLIASGQIREGEEIWVGVGKEGLDFRKKRLEEVETIARVIGTAT